MPRARISNTKYGRSSACARLRTNAGNAFLLSRFRRMPPEIMKNSVSMKGLYQLQRRFPKPVMLLRWLKTTIRMPIPLARSINASLCFIFF